MKKVVIIDYGMGNLNSVARKLKRLGVEPIITSDPKTILEADKIILPGVGHFNKAMENINKRGLKSALDEAILEKKTPILGICLGMQLMAKRSDEGNTEGFGWFDAEVVEFNVSDKLKYKVPHIGWNTLTINKESPIMQGIDSGASFYFVHSFHFKVNDSTDTLNTTNYDYTFTSAIAKDNIFGVQYHPEKSHDIGDQFFTNFINL